MAAFHSLQNFYKLLDNHAVFDLTGTKDETVHPKKIIFPYDKFYIIYTHEKNHGTHAVFYEEVTTCSDERLIEIMKSEGGILYNFKYCNANTSGQLYTASGSSLVFGDKKVVMSILIDHPINSSIPDNVYQEAIKMAKHMIEALLGDLNLKFNSKKYRRVEESPKRIKEVKLHPVRLHERPIIRIIDTEKVRNLYEKHTGNTGRVIPPHPRRAHVRLLHSDWFVNKRGQTVEVKGSNVNGWEWKNSKGVTYKIV